MKQTNRLAAGLSAIASIFLFASCEDKHAHVPHDHDGDGVADPGQALTMITVLTCMPKK